MRIEIEYTTIVDEDAFEMSEDFDISADNEILEDSLIGCDEGHLATCTRPVSEHEIKAFGIKDPDNTVALLCLKAGDASVSRRILVVPPEDLEILAEVCNKLQSIDDGIDFEEEEFSGHQLANYVAACQGREGHTFDEECERIRSMSKKGLSLTGAQQSMIRVCLLRPDLDLQ